jgi:hypothetical protein
VEYDEKKEQVCIIPSPSIPTEEFFALIDVFGKQGYKYFLRADERCGYILSKRRPGEE